MEGGVTKKRFHFQTSGWIAGTDSERWAHAAEQRSGGPGRLPGPSSQMMDLLWRILLLVAACAAAAEDLTKVRAALGENVTLSCSFTDSVIRWYMEIHQRIRVCIVLMMDEDKDNRDHCVYNPEWKYVTRGNNLSIMGITEDDYRCYFCARRKDGHMSFVDTFQVVSGKDAFQTLLFMCWLRPASIRTYPLCSSLSLSR